MRITKPFYMGQCDVTVGQFKKFVADTGYKTEAERTDPGRNDEERADRARFGSGGWGYNAQTRHVRGARPQVQLAQHRLPADRRPSGRQRHLERRRGVLPMAQPQGEEDVSLAHRGAMGICLPGRDRPRATPTATIPSNSPTSPTFRTTLAATKFPHVQEILDAEGRQVHGRR